MLKKDKTKSGGAILTLDEIATLDRQISQLGDCRSLPETEIKNLCEKVRLPHIRQKKFSLKNPMSISCMHL